MSVLTRIASVFKASAPTPTAPATKSQEWFQTGAVNGGYGALDMSSATMAQLWNKWGAATAAIVDIAVYGRHPNQHAVRNSVFE